MANLEDPVIAQATWRGLGTRQTVECFKRLCDGGVVHVVGSFGGGVCSLEKSAIVDVVKQEQPIQTFFSLSMVEGLFRIRELLSARKKER